MGKSRVKPRKIVPIEDMRILAEMPHTVKVRNHLIRYGSITSQEAWRLYGITRLSSVILKLRKKEHPLMGIKTLMIHYRENGVNKSYGKYVFEGEYLT